MNFKTFTLWFPVFSFLVLASGFASAQDLTAPPQSPRSGEQERERVKKIFAAIDERNKTVKKSSEWLNEAYSGVKIRSLTGISKAEYQNYRKYIDREEVYIIVHPGYFTFFMNKEAIPPAADQGGFPAENMVDRLSNTVPPDKINLRVMREQERLIRDFLEYMSMEKKLVILVFPKDYKDHIADGAASALDEYARFINEITNMSESVLYLESLSWASGYLDAENLEILDSFLRAIGVKTVMIGGGYLGKCVDNFYESTRSRFSHENVFFVPELTAISPIDMVLDQVKLLTKDGKISMKGMKKYYTGSAGEKLPLKPLSIYKVYQNR